jgi:hypothetical protein
VKKAKFKTKAKPEPQLQSDVVETMPELKTMTPSGRKFPRPKLRRKGKRVKLPKPGPIDSHWTLFKVALAAYRLDWWPYVKLIGAAEVPIAIISFVNTSATQPDPATDAYVATFVMVMNVILIWSIHYKEKFGTVPSIRQAYYEGSVAIVRFFLVFLLMLMILIPAALGSALYSFGNEAATYSVIPPILLFYVGIAAAIIALPSLYWIVRRVFSLFITVSEGTNPWVAWRKSHAITSQRFWQVAARIVMLLVYSIVVAIPSMLVLFLFTLAGLGAIGSAVFQVLATLTVVPFGYIYLHGLYMELDKTFIATPEPQVPDPVEEETALADEVETGEVDESDAEDLA